ncbi:MAG: flagellar motor protein MotA [Alphaproteobacteria bacterium]|nr:MAG: flagellar motor protein MotA [Alphaproteobacteria bacterium]
MARRDTPDFFRMTRPTSFVGGMFAFLILAGLIAAALMEQITRAFQANPFLNGLILLVLIIGIIFSFVQVYRLGPAVRWIERFRFGEPGLAPSSDAAPPQLLAPMAAMLRDRPTAMTLSATALRSILDSIGTRLDESREISRYLIGLLVFLGLLGTFWGLLQTIGSVADSIRALSPEAGEAEQIFKDLIAGLETPLSGMAIAFSSSLFGLSGSLILGFLDIRAGQAQNRFYNELEEHLSTRTQVALDDFPIDNTADASQTYQALAAAIMALNENITRMQTSAPTGPAAGSDVPVSEAARDLRAAASEINHALERVVGKSAVGAPDSIQDIRNDLRVLTKKITSLTDEGRR